MKNQSLWITIALLFGTFTFSTTTHSQQNRSPQYAATEAGWQWPANSNGITEIPVCWENPLGFSIETQWVRSAIENTWERAANIDFYGWGQCNSGSDGIRILIADTRSKSRVGKHLDGIEDGMELNFTFKKFSSSCQAQNKRENCIKSIAVHEFGHALGFLHEQDRDDSTCDLERGSGAGWKVTEYDSNSVMNYCNPRYNNDGQLSPKDIQGVQTLYGARTVSSQGQVFVSDELGVKKGQVWENIVMDLNGSRQFFSINTFTKEQTRVWNTFGTGTYCYKVWSYTMYSDNLGRLGYGEGCFTLESGKTYSLALAITGWNPGRFSNLALQVKTP